MKKLRDARINLFYLPALAFFAVFVVYSLIKGFSISLTNWNGYSQARKFVGLDNYIRLLTDENTWRAFGNTLIYGIGSTLLQNIFGLAYALFLNQKFRGSVLVRTIVYIPTMIANLIMGYVMYFMVQYNNGAINDVLVALGFQKVDLMASGLSAVIVMTLINSWQFVGSLMIIYMAGLQSIPDMYYEAAQIDGATAWQKFKNITFPLLTPAISSGIVINLIGGLKLFDIICSMTNGGPGFASHSLSTYVSYLYLDAESAGYSAAVGMVTFVIILLLSNVVMNFFDKKEVVM